MLITRGLVETRPGQGTFAVAKLDPFITTLDWKSGFSGGEGSAYYESEVQAGRRKASVSVPRIEIQPDTAAPELQLADGISVVSRHQQRMIDGTPWSLQTSYARSRQRSFRPAGHPGLFRESRQPDGHG